MAAASPSPPVSPGGFFASIDMVVIDAAYLLGYVTHSAPQFSHRSRPGIAGPAAQKKLAQEQYLAYIASATGRNA
jgi:hypothetical protein